MELFNTSTPEKAFTTSVRPLAVLFILQGIIMLSFTIFTWPKEQLMNFPIPFVPDPLKKSFLIVSALLILLIGIGLLTRSKKIWYLFVAYLVGSPIYIISGLIFGYFPETVPKIIIVPLAILFSALISGGLYFVTKPAFSQ